MATGCYTEPLTFAAQGLIDESAAGRIIEAGIRVLKRVGLTADGTDEFFDYLSGYGCKIDGKHVTFPDEVIDRALSRIAAEKQKQLAAKPAVADKITLYASGQGSLWCPAEDDILQPATREHLAAYSRMLDAVGIWRCHPGLIPTDVPRQTAELHAFATIALNSRRPCRVSPYSAAIIPYMIDVMTVVTGSREQAIAEAPFSHKMWMNSPLTIGRESIEGALTSRRLLGHHVAITMMPVSGISAPVTTAGAIVQQVAEVLAANIVSLAIDDVLAGYCSSTLAFCVASSFCSEPGPDSDIRRITGSQVAGHWFGGASASGGMGPRTSAPIPGVQSVMEKAIDMTLAVMAGERTFNSAGTLSQADVASPVQLLLDIEIRDYLQRLIEPVDISEDAMAEEVIIATAPTGARYLESEHTLTHYRRELWSPALISRRAAKSWMDDPVTMLDAARKRAGELLESAPNQSPLRHSQRLEIERICAAADKALAS